MTVIDKDEATVEGSVFLLDGCVYLKTSRGFYELEDEDLYERCREYAKDAPTLQGSFILRREQSTDHESAGFNYPAHRVSESTYSVPLFVIAHQRESFHVCRELCQSLVDQGAKREME